MPNTTSHPNPIGWFLISAAAALVIALILASDVGGPSGLLRVGEDFPIRPYIEADFPDVELASGLGHDGQQYYGIARDPLGRGDVPDLVDNPSYRYLFILYPALAGGFGTFSPQLTVTTMLALSVVGFGLAGASALMLNHQLGGRAIIANLAVANAGLFVSLFMTPDALALGLAMLGVTLAVGGRDRPAAVALALAVLAKTPYFVFPLALGVWAWQNQRARLRWLTVAPAVPAAVWASYVFVRFGPSTSGNLDLPFRGLIRAIDKWGVLTGAELSMALVALGLMVIGTVLAIRTRSRLLQALVLGWVAVGAVSSMLIWVVGNNALRVMAPLWPLTAVAAAVYFSSNRSRRNLPV
ncbi:MAG: hypothetical protein OER12_02990 [Acidimicrobiia bacterium]|nr:hypothetical protein [Acidimicrobiia bacterium]